MTRLRPAAALIEFVYTSRPVPGLPPATLLRVARQSWRFNLKAGITGILRYDAGHFSQVVEGPSDVVLPLSSRILADQRHGEIAIEAFGPISGRRFADWRVTGFDRLCAAEGATGANPHFVDPVDSIAAVDGAVWSGYAGGNVAVFCARAVAGASAAAPA